ncbi:MAG: hypothetical protein ACI8RZ_000731 [Myxococcota bacterium]
MDEVDDLELPDARTLAQGAAEFIELGLEPQDLRLGVGLQACGAEGAPGRLG